MRGELEYNPNAARRNGYDQAVGKVNLDLVTDVELLAAASKKRRKVTLWNHTQPAYGPVLHVRVNFVDLPVPALCTEPEEPCTWCEATRQFNNRETMVCQECGKTKARRMFPIDNRGRRRRPVCTQCNRKRQRAEGRALRAYVANPLKTCSQCKETKPKGEFYKSKQTADGVDSNCKACKKAGVKARRNNETT